MTDDIVERASRAHSPALWKRIDELTAIDEPADDLRAEALERMRAAIEAIREPTEAMVRPLENVYPPYEPRDVWDMMIDAALGKVCA